ncbi:tRNA 2-thiouridine(34) synthase MnmA [bacterium]|nr:tRNA 2-thiouridine(34) synthase MnmA [bacterium]
MNILVGMSGGVDSSVTALLLKQAGHNVIGATMAIWGKDGVYKEIQEKLNKLPKKSSHGACFGPDEKEDIESARKICEQIGIPFYVFDCAKQYEEIVLKSFKEEYLNGRTPNPCIWCNSLIKFDVLPHLAKLNGIEFEKFATGHYSRIDEKGGRYLLKQGINPKKDQSYFLYRLKQEQLKNIILPLGNYTKEEIRKIASDNGLSVANKPDSQDFYEGDYNELLGVEDKIGNIVDRDGKVLGTHKGIWNYTVGQRKGLALSSTEALYVVELRKNTNEVVVDFKDKTFKNKLRATKMNWIAFDELKDEIKCYAKIRSSQEKQEVIVLPTGKDVAVEFVNMQKAISTGQSIVLYQDDVVLGGGIIDEVF